MKQKQKPVRFTHKNFGVLSFLTLSSTAFGLLLAASTPNEQLGEYKPYYKLNPQNQIVGGYKVETRYVPSQYKSVFLTLFVLCVVGIILLPVASDSKGEPLLDMETLGHDFPDTMVKLAHFSQVAFGTGLGTAMSLMLTSAEKFGKTYVVRHLPQKPLTGLQKMLRRKNWLLEFVKSPHLWLVGRTRAGKTYLLLEILSLLFELYGDGKGQWDGVIVTIYDRHYGKPSETGFLNDWLGLPEDPFILSEDEEIMAGLRGELEEFHRRREACKEALRNGQPQPRFPLRVILIDEVNRTAQKLNQKYPLKGASGKGKGQFTDIVSTLIYEAAGYGFKVVQAGQVIAVGETDFSEALRRNICVAILGDDAFDIEMVGVLTKNGAEELVNEAREAARAGHRVAVVSSKGKMPEVNVVGDLSHVPNNRLVVEGSEKPDEVRLWWKKTISQRTLQTKIERLARQYAAGEINSPLKDICKELGIVARKEDDRYRRFFKPYWERLVEDFKEPELDEAA